MVAPFAVAYVNFIEAATSGPSAVTVGIIAALGTLSGALIGGAVTLSVSARERRGARHQELVQAFERYMRSAHLIAAELAELPPARRSAVDRGFDWMIGPRGVFVITRLMNRLVYGRRYFTIQDDYVAAAARLSLIAPAEATAYVAKIDRYLMRWSDEPGSGYLAGWSEMLEGFRLLAQEILDARQGRYGPRLWRRIPGAPRPARLRRLVGLRSRQTPTALSKQAGLAASTVPD